MRPNTQVDGGEGSNYHAAAKSSARDAAAVGFGDAGHGSSRTRPVSDDIDKPGGRSEAPTQRFRTSRTKPVAVSVEGWLIDWRGTSVGRPTGKCDPA